MVFRDGFTEFSEPSPSGSQLLSPSIYTLGDTRMKSPGVDIEDPRRHQRRYSAEGRDLRPWVRRPSLGLLTVEYVGNRSRISGRDQRPLVRRTSLILVNRV